MKFKRDIELSTLYQVKFCSKGTVGVRTWGCSSQCYDTYDL
jgi:hypothetical protein